MISKWNLTLSLAYNFLTRVTFSSQPGPSLYTQYYHTVRSHNPGATEDERQRDVNRQSMVNESEVCVYTDICYFRKHCLFIVQSYMNNWVVHI